MGNLVTLVKYSDFPLTTGLIIRRLASMAQTDIDNSSTTAATTAASTAPTVAPSVAPSSPSSSSNTPATINSRDETFQRTALHCACLRSNEVLIKLLVGFDADINAVDGFGFTPFHYAAWRVKDQRWMFCFILFCFCFHKFFFAFVFFHSFL